MEIQTICGRKGDAYWNCATVVAYLIDEQTLLCPRMPEEADDEVAVAMVVEVEPVKPCFEKETVGGIGAEASHVSGGRC